MYIGVYTDRYVYACIDIHGNGYNLAPPELPFGGRKGSGFGEDYVMYTYIHMCMCMYTHRYIVGISIDREK